MSWVSKRSCNNVYKAYTVYSYIHVVSILQHATALSAHPHGQEQNYMGFWYMVIHHPGSMPPPPHPGVVWGEGGVDNIIYLFPIVALRGPPPPQYINKNNSIQYINSL